MKCAIIALGWLGRALQQHWKNKLCISGSYCHTPKNYDGEFQFQLGEQLPLQIKDADRIFFNLSPSAIHSLKVFQKFCNAIKKKEFVFISSTSVYGQTGKVTEADTPSPVTDSGKLLLECETFVREHFRDYWIIRPAGLMGADRHPARYLAGRRLSCHHDDVVNLIEQVDLLKLIDQVTLTETKIVNAVNANHPYKKDYYIDYCQRHNLPLPHIELTNEKNGKQVDTQYPQFVIKSSLL